MWPFAKKKRSDVCPNYHSSDTWVSEYFRPSLRFCRVCQLRWGGDGGDIIDPGYLPKHGGPIYIKKLEYIKNN